MALKQAGALEILFYLLVVASLQILVFKDGMLLSDEAAAALTSMPRSHLPARLASMLYIPPTYLATHQTQAREQEFSSTLHQLLPTPVQWLLSRPRDVSDVQWRDFRGGLGSIVAAMACFVLLSRLARLRSTRMRLINNAMASIVFLGVIHGPTGTLWVLILAGASFLLSNAVAGTRMGPALIWGWHCASFLFIRWNDGLKFAGISPSLSYLDGHSSMLRWHIHYNFLLLRLLSYAMDLHWARQAQQQKLGKQEGEVGAHTPRQRQLAWEDSIKSSRNPRARIELPLPSAMYSWPQHFVYCFYPPLYIAGPTMTFNDFVSQVALPVAQGCSQVLEYGVRWLGAALLMEFMSRTLYFNAIAKYGLLTKGTLANAGVDVRPYHFALTGFWVLVYMWLKFLIIWRFFRTVALADGIIPPENMGRCVCNNYDIEGFWRSWHASYNRWLVRYIYVPLGGNRTRVYNVWLVFLFVAAWHDLEPRLLHWGLIMPGALVPEMAVKALGRTRWASRYVDSCWYRHVAAIAAVFNIIGLMCINLVGFVVGLEGLLPLLHEVLGQVQTAAPVLFALFCAVQLMFAKRSLEEAGTKSGKQDRDN